VKIYLRENSCFDLTRDERLLLYFLADVEISKYTAVKGEPKTSPIILVSDDGGACERYLADEIKVLKDNRAPFSPTFGTNDHSETFEWDIIQKNYNPWDAEMSKLFDVPELRKIYESRTAVISVINTNLTIHNV